MKFKFEWYPGFTDTDGEWFAMIVCDVLMFVIGLFICVWY